MNKPIMFDIETVPESREVLDALMPVFDPAEVKLGNLKDETKIAAKLIEAELDMKHEFIEKAALHAATGQVAMIGYLVEDEMVIHEAGDQQNESTVIRIFFDKVVECLQDSTSMIGFNTHEFDLPFLVRRAWKHRIHTPHSMFRGRYFSDLFLDLRQLWLMGERSPARGSSSLEALARFFGLPPKSGKGEDFARMTREERVAHLKQDLRLTQELWRRMC
jgi:DNA polymerase elongation subunit (family B)